MAGAIATDPEEKPTPSADAEGAAFVELFAGTALNATDAHAITLRAPAHLVVFAGAEDSGKTTVLASIYERLSQGPFAGFQFAGSRTLLGFEEICHLNRLESGSARPDTPRTIPTEEAAYYHLALTDAEAGAHRSDLLLSAMSGELFRMAMDSREDCERLVFLHRADTLVVLVDGARLAVPELRANAYADASGILESFLDARMVGARCRVEFAFSKLDRVVAAGDSALEFLSAAQERLRSKFHARVPNLTFRRIAARPDASLYSDGLADGLADAFASWVAPRPSPATEMWAQNAPPSEAREFNKFGWRYFEQTRRYKP